MTYTSIYKELIGRQVYINKGYHYVYDNFNSRKYLTGKTLYTIVAHSDTGLPVILDNQGNRIIIMLNPRKCAHLSHNLGWTLKRTPKKNQQ